MANTEQHDPAICQRDIRGTQYTGKSYKSLFTCPECGRTTWQNLNFLGRREVICDGVNFTKREKGR